MDNMSKIQDEFEILRKIHSDKRPTQRKLSTQLGFSLGKLNCCINALKQKGLIKIENDKLEIVITNLNPLKRPISAVADNLEFRNAKLIIVKSNRKVKFNLLYDKNRSLQKKIKIEQLRNEIK